MKRIRFLLVAILMLAFLPGLQAQSSSVDRYFETYKQDTRFSRVTVSSKMFNLFLEMEADDPEEQAVIETISKLKGLKMLIGQEVSEAETVFKDVLSQPAKDMDELMTVSDQGKEIQFFISEEGGKISELLMVGYEGDKVIILSLVGEIDLKEIAKLSKKMNLEGFENFKNVHK